MSVEDILAKHGRRIYHRLFSNFKNPVIRDNYFGKKILSNQEGNDCIATKLQSNMPFLAARLGQAELATIINYNEIIELNNSNIFKRVAAQIYGKDKNWSKLCIKEIETNAGVFPPTDTILKSFSEIYINSIKQIDALGVWFSYGEDLMYNANCPEADLIPLVSLEPYYHNNPWSKWLKNKKVLVIHPFEKSINQQYAKHQYLFKDNEVLPDFELITLKAVQSIAGSSTPFINWMDALEFMKEEVNKIDFDIAIIGAGAYGLPLGAHVKKMGKQAIHMGGATQILFGIKGKRWENNVIISTFFNEHWVRPLPEETPEKSISVENACYW